MKIYICGAHASGKTTLAKYISTKYNLPMIPEVARTILSEKELNLDLLRTDLDLVDSFQNDIFYRQIKEEAKLTSFVSDRSFDCLAYTAQHARILSKLFFSDDLKKYIDKIKEEKSIIFFVRPSKITMKSDGVRETLSWEGIIAIDAIVKFLLEVFDLKYFPIAMDSMQERIKLVDSVLSLI